MGRIRTQLIKRKTNELGKSIEFTEDFSHNKKLLSERAAIPSKKIRNQIAGYAVIVKQSKKF